MTDSYPPIADLIETFDFFDDWQDRYRYVIDMGKELPPFEEELKTQENKVDGCVSQVWLVAERDPQDPNLLTFRGDSDAFIVKGLIAILLKAFSGRSPKDILETDARALLDRLGLSGHLSPSRSNGLFSMVKRIREMALEAAA